MIKYLTRELLLWFYNNHKIARDKEGGKVPYKIFYSRFYTSYKRTGNTKFIKEVEYRLRLIEKDKEDTLDRIKAML
ncbi:hypothetical protein LCGC14_0903770 [marine sediment metagenome]|uniref:Uncharacterized protein n=1 Tax=marine sediment metagenome TaxID=412755 RepID=A0A0F9PGD7_9ZZZZ